MKFLLLFAVWIEAILGPRGLEEAILEGTLAAQEAGARLPSR